MVTVQAITSPKPKTGNNDASGNTNGTTDVLTGNGNATVDLTVEGGTNTLNP